ncbi:PPC domain-containing protein [Symmachiella dynata]|uniref:PPC domain-containing protein n=1 Tax=Symmachiella dynata TaxID=2527995 RepID=UPI0030EF2A4D
MRNNRSLLLVSPRFRSPRFASLLLAGCTLVMLTNTSHAQLPQNRMYAIFPPGGQAGAKVDLTITNSADGDEVSRLYFSHPGITAEQKTKVVNGREVPVANQFQIRIDEKVPPGVYDVRSSGLFGMSNPRTFVVGTHSEVQEAEANNTPETATAIEQGAVVNARSNAAGDIDFFKFPATKGQRLIIECRAKRIDSRMDATLELYDPNGRRVAFSRNEMRGDPLIDYTIPADGEYLLRVYDFLYQGNNDYIYRLLVHAGPHIEFVLPPAGVPNTTGEFTLYGQNLPGGQPSGMVVSGSELEKLAVKIPVPADPTELQPGTYLQPYEASVDGFSYRLDTPQGPTNPVLIHFARTAAQLEAEPNNEAAQATNITVDYYQFEAKAKAVYWIEVFGQRIGSTVDPMLIIEQVTIGKDGKETVKRLTAQDDVGTNLGAQGFDTRTDDPAFRFVAPADGIYRIQVRDRYFESRGDPRLVYRIEVRNEDPDFRLVALPRPPVLAANAAGLPATWDLALRKGDHTELEVLAFRQDGFNGTIDVTVAGLPAGVTCPVATIGPGQNSTRLMFTSTEDAPEWMGPIQIVGKVRKDDPAALKAERDARTALDKLANSLPATQQTADTATAALTTVQKTLAEQLKKNEAADALAKQTADAAAASKTALDTAAAKVATAQQAVAATTAAVEATSKTFVDAAVAKATADRQAAETVKMSSQAVVEKLAAQQAKDAAAEAAADKRIIDAAVAAKLAADAQVAATAAFETAITAKNKAVADKAAAQTALTAGNEAHKKATEAYAVAMKAATDAAAVAAQETAAKTAAEQAIAQANEQAQKATAALTEAKKQMAAAETAWTTAKQNLDAKAQQIARVARGGTIVWSGNQTLTAAARVARNTTLAVLKESAPFEINTDITDATVSQGAQLLIPVKLAKRTGFDNKVDLTFEGMPKNVDVDKKAIEKGKAEQLLRVFVKDNVAPGKYTLHLRGQGQISYSRNPDAVKRTEEEKQFAIKAATEAAALVKKTGEEKAAADKQATEAQAAATKAGEALVAADVAIVAAKQAVEAAAAEKANADKSESDAAAQEAAAKKLAEAQAALAKAEADRATADQKATAASDAFTQAQAAKNNADRAAAEAAATAKTAEAVKKAAEAAAAAAVKTAKAAKVNVFTPSNSITVTVKPAPLTIKAPAPNKGAVKRGGEVKIPVTIARKNGFTGPVTLSLTLPPGVTGLTAPSVTIPADKNDGEFVIKTTADTTEGKLANIVIRASMIFDGETFVDSPLELTVSK